ncbi:hypothetical protein MKY82_13355 [Paenibacillus sp. FSL W7-1279]|uniref:hypothetical protein n=1 Tax=unclassified Paenibacillus TaxID=185978 RepID=UPI00188CBE35|nr:hypothetical protein [Paenibacillus sp. JZ16]
MDETISSFRKEEKPDEVMKEIIERYRLLNPETVLKLFNYIIVKSNMNFKENNKSDFSLKLFLDIIYLYSCNGYLGNKETIDFEEEYSYISEKIELIQDIYYWSIVEENKTHTDSITTDAFMSYHFDYHLITLRQYNNFINSNSELFNNNFGGDFKSNEIVKGIYALMKIEFCLKENKHLELIHNYYIEHHPELFAFVGNMPFYLLIPKLLAERILINYNIPLAFIDTFIKEIQISKEELIHYPTDIKKITNHTVGYSYNNLLLFPRTYFILDRLLNNMLFDNKSFLSKKGDITENYCMEILLNLFEESKIFKGLYDEMGNEQDIIVLHNDTVIVFECKSSTLREPFRNYMKSKVRLAEDFKESIQKAYNQGLRVIENIRNGTAVYYDNDNKNKRNLILNLNIIKPENVIIVAVTLTTYLSLANKIHLLLERGAESNQYPWAIDVFSLEHIVNKCKRDFDSDYLIKYIRARIETFGSTFSSAADEVSYFGFYTKYNRFYNGANYNAFMMLGPGYSSFVIDEEKENFLSLSELGL